MNKDEMTQALLRVASLISQGHIEESEKLFQTLPWPFGSDLFTEESEELFLEISAFLKFRFHSKPLRTKEDVALCAKRLRSRDASDQPLVNQ